MSRRFGTDGVRGVANDTLTPEFAFDLGRAAAQRLLASEAPPRVVLGRDTRRSGAMLQAALTAGFCAGGADVASLGVAPTPTVAFYARTGGFGLGGIVSASHNPAPDNGIKFVGSGGAKLDVEAEAAIEALAAAAFEGRPTGARIGDAQDLPPGHAEYLDFLEALVPERLDGMRVALDAAHGAAFRLGPEILRRLGATAIASGVEPDGMNINAEGGATKPEAMCRLVQTCGADAGVAFDGDADRAVFADETGRLINGDRTLGIWASAALARGELEPRLIVGTEMSNGGFERYLADLGVRLIRTPVGDRHVAATLLETGALAGGEQSGHLIFPRHGPTGDGLVTMLEFLRVVRLAGAPASELASAYAPWPQLLVNFSVEDPAGWRGRPAVADAVARAEAAIAGRGRIGVRPSGTQPMLRVMIEADAYDLRDAAAAIVEAAIVGEWRGSVYSRVDLTHALGD